MIIEQSDLSKLHAYNQAIGEIQPQNVLVLYRQGDTPGQDIATHYQTQRPGVVLYELPTSLLAWTSPGGNNSQINAATMAAVNTAVLAAARGMTVRAIVLCGHWPFAVTVNAGKGYGASGYWNFDGILSNFQTGYSTASAIGDITVTAPSMRPVNDFTTTYFANVLADQFAFAYATRKETGGAVPVFRLEFIEPNAADTTIASPSMAAYAKRMVDDAVAAEQARYSDFGNVLFTGSSSYYGRGFATAEFIRSQEVSGIGTRWAENLATDTYPTSQFTRTPVGFSGDWWPTMLFRNGSYLYSPEAYQHLAAVQANSAPTYPTTVGARFADGAVNMVCMTALPADNLAAGTTTSAQYASGTFVVGAYNDLMVHAVGTNGYISSGASWQPHDINAYGYRKGAIAVWAQSYGAAPNPQLGVDYDFDTIDAVGFGLQTQADTNCLSPASAGLRVQTTQGVTTSLFTFSRAAGPTSATIAYDAPSRTLTAKEAGAVVGTPLVLNAGSTYRSAAGQIHAWIAGLTGWSFSTGQNGISRCMQSIRGGACAAFGATNAAYDIDVDGMPFPTGLTKLLWEGWALGEIAPMVCDVAAATIYGDPLYRPFGHRRIPGNGVFG